MHIVATDRLGGASLGVALLLSMLITIVGCGGGSDDQQQFTGDIVPLTGTLNGSDVEARAPTSCMTSGMPSIRTASDIPVVGNAGFAGPATPVNVNV